ncbi:MAG: hypothetical protein QOC68_4514 [Solirubrobacteraceae bacterium]|jgi:signal transduction histidine kinase|nr:hypothetical protein [Solirubrobacteraceae bacterium]
MTRSPRPGLAVAVAVAGAVALATARGDPTSSFGGGGLVPSVLEAAAGVCLLAVGLTALGRDRERSIGALLVAAAAAWFLIDFNNPGAGAAVFTLGLVLATAAPAVVAHVVLSDPDGGLRSWPARAAVGLGYFLTLGVLGVASAVVFEPRAEECLQCPRNLLLVAGDRQLHGDLSHVGVDGTLVWSLLVLVLLSTRFVRSSPARRRARGPLLAAGGLYIALVAVDLMHSAQRGYLSNDSVDQQLWTGQAIALLLLAGGVAAAWWRARRRRFQIARLVVELGATPPPDGLRDALAALLDDPTLELSYPLADGRVVDGHGRSARVQGQTTALVRGEETVALLSHRPGLFADGAIAAEVAGAARLALENERLQAEARARLEDLRAARARVVAAGDAARRQLERDLHDGAQPRLVALLLATALHRSRHGTRTDHRIDELQAELELALEELRQIAQGAFPALLGAEGLAVALQELSEEPSSPLELSAVTAERFESRLETTAYFVVAEAIRLAAPGRVAVRAERHNSRLVIELQTDNTPSGTIDLEDRVGAVDGTLSILRRDDGRTTLQAELPCGS